MQEGLLEAATGVEPVIKVLQSVSRSGAGPYVAIYFRESVLVSAAQSRLSSSFFFCKQPDRVDFLK